MSTVSLMTSLLTEDCSRFLPPQHRTLDHRLFEDVSVAQQDPLMTQNANVVDLEDGLHGAGCHSDTSGQDSSDTKKCHASTASLKDIRCGARSQCSRWSRGMIWSYRVALNTSRALRQPDEEYSWLLLSPKWSIIVSGGALNSTHSLTPWLLQSIMQSG